MVTWLNWNGKSAYIFKWWFHLAPIRLSRFALSLLTSLRHCSFFVISLPSLFCSFHLSSSLFISLRLSGPPVCCSPSLFVACLRSLFVARRRPSPLFTAPSSRFVALRRFLSLFVVARLSSSLCRLALFLYLSRFCPSLSVLSRPPCLLFLYQPSSSFLLPFLHLASPPSLKLLLLSSSFPSPVLLRSSSFHRNFLLFPSSFPPCLVFFRYVASSSLGCVFVLSASCFNRGPGSPAIFPSDGPASRPAGGPANLCFFFVPSLLPLRLCSLLCVCVCVCVLDSFRIVRN